MCDTVLRRRSSVAHTINRRSSAVAAAGFFRCEAFPPLAPKAVGFLCWGRGPTWEDRARTARGGQPEAPCACRVQLPDAADSPQRRRRSRLDHHRHRSSDAPMGSCPESAADRHVDGGVQQPIRVKHPRYWCDRAPFHGRIAETNCSVAWIEESVRAAWQLSRLDGPAEVMYAS
jgi:hypothetical protein